MDEIIKKTKVVDSTAVTDGETSKEKIAVKGEEGEGEGGGKEEEGGEGKEEGVEGKKEEKTEPASIGNAVGIIGTNITNSVLFFGNNTFNFFSDMVTPSPNYFINMVVGVITGIGLELINPLETYLTPIIFQILAIIGGQNFVDNILKVQSFIVLARKEPSTISSDELDAEIIIQQEKIGIGSKKGNIYDQLKINIAGKTIKGIIDASNTLPGLKPAIDEAVIQFKILSTVVSNLINKPLNSVDLEKLEENANSSLGKITHLMKQSPASVKVPVPAPIKQAGGSTKRVKKVTRKQLHNRVQNSIKRFYKTNTIKRQFRLQSVKAEQSVNR
jgi:hypothetical protein